MTLVGVAYSPWSFWDGRKDSLWAQALEPLESPLEHGGTRLLVDRGWLRFPYVPWEPVEAWPSGRRQGGYRGEAGEHIRAQLGRRSFAERMFHVVFLDRLDHAASSDAILKPIEKAKCPLPLSENLIEQIITESGGYPYVIQFICREVYDVALQKHDKNEPPFLLS